MVFLLPNNTLRTRNVFLLLSMCYAPKMFQKLQVANEEYDSLPFLSRKLNTIKASYLETLTQSRLKCTRNTELHPEAFMTASACNKHILDQMIWELKKEQKSTMLSPTTRLQHSKSNNKNDGWEMLFKKKETVETALAHLSPLWLMFLAEESAV